MKTYDKLYINGQWIEGTGSSMLKNTDPYTGELLYEYRSASKEDVDAAYQAAKEASKSWRATLPAEKRNYLEKLLEAVISLKDEMYEVSIKEGGSAPSKAGFEFFTTIEIIKEAMRMPEHSHGKILPSNIPGKANYIIRQPRGVIGVIAPWNVPFVLAMRSVVPAIATGNTVVLKPASDTPASALLIAEFFDKAGFPPGVFNAIVGRGSEIGDSITNHPIPNAISFTGSTEVGRHIGSIASNMIKDISLELGGNNVMMVCKDADLEHAAKAAAFGSHFNAGQVCMAINRIIIEEEVYEDFAKIYKEVVEALPFGNPAEANTFIGPIINGAQVKKVQGYIDATISEGAKVLLEGKTEGNVMSPWILGDVTNDMTAARNEVFGPVTSLIKVKDIEEAIAVANDTEYGLSGSVFTKDKYRGIEIAKRLETGMVHINDQSINDEPHVMFGGMKQSGVGRFNSQWVADKFTIERWISVQEEYRPF